jgi:hypothetical protein
LGITNGARLDDAYHLSCTNDTPAFQLDMSDRTLKVTIATCASKPDFVTAKTFAAPIEERLLVNDHG